MGTVGQVRSTSDPVGITEIAERCGVARRRVEMWRKRGVLPDEHWIISGRVAVWDWAELADSCDVVSRHIGTMDWSWVPDAIPKSRQLVELVTPQDTSWRNGNRWDSIRVPGNEQDLCGWVSIPLPGGERWMVTDWINADGLPINYADAVTAARAKLRALPSLVQGGDYRQPTVSINWGGKPLRAGLKA